MTQLDAPRRRSARRSPGTPCCRGWSRSIRSEFAADYWGQQALLSTAADLPRSFADLLSNEAVDELVSERGLRTPFLRVAKSGSTLADKAFTAPGGVGAGVADQVSDDKLVRLFADGSTMVLQGLHRVWPPIIAFCQRLAAELGHPVQANAYVTPPQNQGFSNHYDVHDVFVLQIEGEKRWQIHAPVHEAPLRDQPWTDRRAAVERRAEEPPLIEAVLRPGDCLYLPRGFLHAATALGTVSTHLTIGVHSWTRYALAEQLLAEALRTVAQDPPLRASLPLGVDFGDLTALAGRDRPDPGRAGRGACSGWTMIKLSRTLQQAARGTQRAAPIGPLRQLRDAERDRRRHRHRAAQPSGRDARPARRPHRGAQPGGRLPGHRGGCRPGQGAAGRRLGSAPTISAWNWPAGWCWPAWPSWGERGHRLRSGAPRPPGCVPIRWSARHRRPAAGCCSSIPDPGRSTPSPGPGIDPSMLSALTGRAAESATRILLVRRPGRLSPDAPRRWILVGLDGATRSGPWRHDDDLAAAAAALDGDQSAAGRSGPDPAGLHARRSRHLLRAPGPPGGGRAGGHVARIRSGSAATSAATGSHRTWSCCPTASTTATSIPRRRWAPSDATSAVRWPSSTCAGWPASPRRSRRRSPRPSIAADRSAPTTSASGPCVRSGRTSGTARRRSSNWNWPTADRRGSTSSRYAAREARLTCRAARDTPATEYRVEIFEVRPADPIPA